MIEFTFTVREIDALGAIEKGLAKMDPAMMAQLDLQPGDAIYIKNRGNKTFCRVMPLEGTIPSPDIIRLDFITRKNCSAALGSKVTVGKAEGVISDAEIELKPFQSVLFADQDHLLRENLKERIVWKGDQIRFRLINSIMQFRVDAIRPPDVPVLISNETRFVITPYQEGEGHAQIRESTFEDIGGLHDEIAKIKEIFQLPLQHPEIFRYLGIAPLKGVLLYGPPGCGKTLIAKAISAETNSAFFSINGPVIMSKMLGESEKNLRDIFHQASVSSPSIILIDEVDSIAPSRDEARGDVEKRVVTQLLSLMDGLEERKQVVVIGTTNRPDAIDSALRRGGRLDREIQISAPNLEGRLEILQIHTRWLPIDKNLNLLEIARRTHGFVGADLAMLVKVAAFMALREKFNIDDQEGPIPFKHLKSVSISIDHFKEALKEIHPSSLREFSTDIPVTTWDDIGGLEREKEELREMFEWPLRYPMACRRLRIQPAKGVMLYGESGCGKTLLAKAIATEISVNFIYVKGPEVISKWVGESERAIRELFKKARIAAPCIIFFDEIDTLAPSREKTNDATNVTNRVVSQLLTEMDALDPESGVMILAATNALDMVEPALLRAGRFDSLFEIPPPDARSRAAIFDIYTRDRPLADDIDINYLIEHTEGSTGAYISALCVEAAKQAMRGWLRSHEDLPGAVEPDVAITMDDFRRAINRLNP